MDFKDSDATVKAMANKPWEQVLLEYKATLKAACDPSNSMPPLTAMLYCADILNAVPWLHDQARHTLKRLATQTDDHQVATNALHLTHFFMKNVVFFRAVLAKSEFVDKLIDTLPVEVRDPNHKPLFSFGRAKLEEKSDVYQERIDKTLLCIQAWAGLHSFPSFQEKYMNLVQKGVKFPTPLPGEQLVAMPGETSDLINFLRNGKINPQTSLSPTPRPPGSIQGSGIGVQSSSNHGIYISSNNSRTYPNNYPTPPPNALIVSHNQHSQTGYPAPVSRLPLSSAVSPPIERSGLETEPWTGQEDALRTHQAAHRAERSQASHVLNSQSENAENEIIAPPPFIYTDKTADDAHNLATTVKEMIDATPIPELRSEIMVQLVGQLRQQDAHLSSLIQSETFFVRSSPSRVTQIMRAHVRIKRVIDYYTSVVTTGKVSKEQWDQDELRELVKHGLISQEEVKSHYQDVLPSSIGAKTSINQNEGIEGKGAGISPPPSGELNINHVNESTTIPAPGTTKLMGHDDIFSSLLRLDLPAIPSDKPPTRTENSLPGSTIEPLSSYERNSTNPPLAVLTDNNPSTVSNHGNLANLFDMSMSGSAIQSGHDTTHQGPRLQNTASQAVSMPDQSHASPISSGSDIVVPLRADSEVNAPGAIIKSESEARMYLPDEEEDPFK